MPYVFWLIQVFVFCFFCFLLFRATPTAYGGSQVRVELELQLPAYPTATAAPDPSRICGLRRGSQQRQILNQLSEARDQGPNLQLHGS